MQYTPGSGLKKPMNMLENPVYPDIKKGPPEFKWSRKFWQVDVGATLRETEPYTNFLGDSILTQSRDYNKTVYGTSSHRDIVNAEFRPPLISPYEDNGPVNRIPATIHAIVPRINPGTAGHDGGTSGYTAKNERPSDIESALTDRIKSREWRPTFYAPMDLPQDNSVLPDLQVTIPSVSASAGWNIPIQIDAAYQHGNERAMHESYTIPLDSGYSSGVNIDAPVREDFVLLDNRPNYSASSGMNTNLQIDAETQTPILQNNRPAYSADAGSDTNFTIISEDPNIQLDEKLGYTPLTVLNPGSEEGYKGETSYFIDPNEHIQNRRRKYSYIVPPENSYREQNVLTEKKHFQERLQTEKTYGQVSQTGGYIQKFDLERPELNLRGRTYHKYSDARPVKQYRF